MMYKSGIYHSIDEKTWMTNNVPRPEWEKVDHSVLLVGWGEDSQTGEKFWIIQNTWGETWGENGFFRMKRGKDEFGIESICEAADPYYIKNKNFVEKKPNNFNNYNEFLNDNGDNMAFLGGKNVANGNGNVNVNVNVNVNGNVNNGKYYNVQGNINEENDFSY